MVLDIFVAIIILLSAYIGYRQGGAKMFVSLLCFVLSFTVAIFLGDFLADFIYDSFISQSVVDSVSQYTLSADTVSVEPTVDSLPAFVESIVNFTGYESNSALIDAVNNTKEAIAVSVESAIKPVVVSVLSFLITAVLYFVVHFILKFTLCKAILAVFKLPVIRMLDSIVGVICSVICAVLLISFLAFLLKLVAPHMNDMPDLLSEQTIYNSYIFKHFYNGNIFSAITSLI